MFAIAQPNFTKQSCQTTVFHERLITYRVWKTVSLIPQGSRSAGQLQMWYFTPLTRIFPCNLMLFFQFYGPFGISNYEDTYINSVTEKNLSSFWWQKLPRKSLSKSFCKPHCENCFFRWLGAPFCIQIDNSNI